MNPVTKTDYYISILRNPCGFSAEQIKQAQLGLCDYVQEVEKDADRLVAVMNNFGNRFAVQFASHVLQRGGTGDLSDCRTFVDAYVRTAK